MPKFSIKNRIARYYIVSTALLIFAVFVVVYHSVKVSVYNDIDRDLQAEIETLSEQLVIEKHSFRISNLEEWEEREHKSLGINPIFIELVNSEGIGLDKSPNLSNYSLVLDKGKKEEIFYDADLKGNSIRQVQFPVFHNGILKGYVLIAMSLQDAKTVLFTLAEVLFIGYFLILVVLYYITRFIVGRSIKPITSIIETASLISKDNLNTRILLPQNKDELYKLSQTINDLLERIENTIEREKRFTSDASHELRTPLAVVKGTLEVLIRKPRLQIEYEDKINFCISEVNRMNILVDQLLLLARFENQKKDLKIISTSLNALILEVLSQNSTTISAKKIEVNTNFDDDFYINTDPYLFSIVFQNLISNAVKYSFSEGKIEITVRKEENELVITIQDFGIGISKADIENVFNPFYRSNPTEHPQIKGMGLGLSIVNRLSELLQFEIMLSSENSGTLVTLKLK